ncbi:germinal-center associated nuclear protein isoform X2 [Hypomesus transpacificus]|uniref:germinal-center associated nuclear protein isoform X2 n=1 Tax=Hypomesus transpacificus TaxID=137520 RepID=UPI001F088313|nr:germinal-center associated nuclear protein isoform X2 [Hypomesus transpacificus]
MNHNSLFGRPQGRVFQSPNKTGMFQSFGPPGSTTSSQGTSFGQTATFGQSSTFSQPADFGPTSEQTSMFGQSPAFGQGPSLGQSSLFGNRGGLDHASSPSSTFSTMTQAPAFGQTLLGQSGTGFSGPPPSYGRVTGNIQSSVFGQTPAFGQTSAFGEPSEFGQQTQGFSLPSGTSQVSSGTTPSSGSRQSMSCSQTPFGLPHTTPISFGAAPSAVHNIGFRTSEFSFKPCNEALFKPIFSVSPEPANSLLTAASEKPFSSDSQPSSNSMDSSGSTSSGFCLLTNDPVGFSFSQPAAAPTISAPSGGIGQNDPLTTNATSSTLQFTFSQPGTPYNTNTNVNTEAGCHQSAPRTPSSFSFVPKVILSQPVPPMAHFGRAISDNTLAFRDSKTKTEGPVRAEERDDNQESAFESTILSRLGKGTKRKEEPVGPCTSAGNPTNAEYSQAGTDEPRHPPKRPLLRSRAPMGGLFHSAMSGLMKSTGNVVRRELLKEGELQQPELGETEIADTLALRTHKTGTQTSGSVVMRETKEKAEEIGSVETPDKEPETKTPVRRAQRGDSIDSLGGLSPTDTTNIQCKNVPANLNKKDILEKHFARFGKICRIMCRPQKNLATVHFQDHTSAAKAKKKGKLLHKHELLIFWQRKKITTGNKGEKPPEREEPQTTGPRLGGFLSSPLRRPPPKVPIVSSTASINFSSPGKKSSVAKSFHFDSEPQLETSSEGQVSDCSVPSSLLHLIGQQADTAEDKYRLLEQRDKILRQGRPKRTDLDLSKVFVGTCPDMCPEKERYMRETRNQLSAYEVVPNTEMVDHVAAIKEYSRSSADQEEPLPYELRPLTVLSMTMNYLVSQIMDQSHDNYRDWYDFVWNRTRGIRKDITQQHLCDPLTVSLIEKCARFHVHCAHHLCEEPMMSFDAKINNENLTKCMQSLKEMYQDLANRSVFCPQEAEFRQYNVLLKLNDGDILREVQQFRDEVRNSPEVKFAVQAFATLNSNNFVRFFKLVKSASYLSGCLLHRYFNQVRGKALRTLNIAHTVGSQRSTIFPIEDMVRMLMFRNTAEATDFIQQHGLNISDGMVELSRTTYQDPDVSLLQRKSEAIIRKRTVLIGEVVNGGPLPKPTQHTPFCSFDSHNKYRGTGPLAEPTTSTIRTSHMRSAVPMSALVPEVKAQSEAEIRPQMLAEPRLFGEPQLVPEPFKPAVVDKTGELGALTHVSEPQQLVQPAAQLQPIQPPSPPPKPEPVYSDEDILVELEGVVEEVLEAVVSEVARAGADYAMSALNESSGQVEVMVSEVVEQVLKEVSAFEIHSEEEITAAKKLEMEEVRKKQEHEAFLAQFSDSLFSKISQEILTECIHETAALEIQLALEEKATCVARCTDEVCTNLVDETLKEEIVLLVEDVLQVELQRIHKYIRRWHDVVAVRRQLKRQMRGFPAAPCCVDPHFKLQALAPSAPSRLSMEHLARGLVNLGNTGYMALSSTRLLKMRKDAIHQMRVHTNHQQLLNESVWTPLDLPTLVAENTPNPSDWIYWKATLLLPSVHQGVTNIADWILSDWLEVKLGRLEEVENTEMQPDSSLRTLYIGNGLREKEQRIHKVHVCVKVSFGPLTEEGLSKMEEQTELQGTGALLMLLPTQHAPEPGSQDQDVPLLSALLQLKQLQHARAWHCSLPLAILVPGPEGCLDDTQKLEQDLMLLSLVEDGLISKYVFIHIPETTSDLQGSKQVSQAVSWLVAHTPTPPLLSSQTLVQFVEAGLCSEFSSRLYRNRQKRVKAGLPYQDPMPVIQLYNAVLAYLAELVSSQHFSSLSWPPGEFALPDTRDQVPHLGWNKGQHLDWLRATILSLQIPDWDLPPASDPWPQLCSSIFQYASQMSASHSSQPLLMSKLENLLERVRCQGKCSASSTALSEWEEEEEKQGSSFHQIPWDEVVAQCIDHKLKDWQPSEDLVCSDAVTDDGEILVYFVKEEQKVFEPPVQWKNVVTCIHPEKWQNTDGFLSHYRSERASPDDMGHQFPYSLRQRLFQSVFEVPEPTAPTIDITHRPSMELLPFRVLENLKEEKAQSQRCVDQLQCWLDVDCMDSLSLPLFMPSTLLSMPAIMVPQLTAAGYAKPLSLIQDTDDQSERAEHGWLKSEPYSQRMKELKMQILASQEEDLACSLKLTSLLNIVED